MTWASKLAASLAGSFLESEATNPLFSSLTETFLTLKPTLSPGTASVKASWCISTDLTSVVGPVGAKFTTTHRDCSNTTNLVDILKRKTEGLINRSGGWFNVVQGIKEGFEFITTRFAFNLLLLPPGHVLRLL